MRVPIHDDIQDLYPKGIGVSKHDPGKYSLRSSGIDEYVMLFTIKGEGTATFKKKSHIVQLGDVVILPKAVPHRYGATASDTWEYIYIHFDGCNASHVLSTIAWTHAAPLIKSQYAGQVGELFNEMNQLLLSGDRSVSTLLCMSTCLQHIFGRMAQQIATGVSEQSHHQQIKQSIAYMRDHISENSSVSDFSRIAAMSESRYFRLFRETTGFTPMDYFVRQKMIVACCRLLESDMSIRELAAELGYDDPYHFSRVFKRVNGYSPRAYRKSESP
jgi:AraC family transcriptional regulator, arabinose operon regulatory protein